MDDMDREEQARTYAKIASFFHFGSGVWLGLALCLAGIDIHAEQITWSSVFACACTMLSIMWHDAYDRFTMAWYLTCPLLDEERKKLEAQKDDSDEDSKE